MKKNKNIRWSSVGFIAGVHDLQIQQSKRDPENSSESFI